MIHFARTRLLALENTIGGRVLPPAYLRAGTEFAHSRGLATHLDGARIFNAVVKLGHRRARSGARIRFGVGVPIQGTGRAGGLGAWWAPGLSSTHARRWRKALGGGMRQAGVLAAAGLYALEHHVARLAEDHDKPSIWRRACAPRASR